jgi:hypothetical protein
VLCPTEGGKGIVKKSKIALKPYLDTIAGYCDTLSNQELTAILLSLARDVPTSGRVNFLEKIESYLPGRRPPMIPDTDAVEQILYGIEALKESIEGRIRSIKDGSYWDDPDVSNKHRRAYERTAQVLGSLAEVYLAMGQKGKAVKILHTYYSEKYNRFSAFRKEAKEVVKDSDLLRNSGFLN